MDPESCKTHGNSPRCFKKAWFNSQVPMVQFSGFFLNFRWEFSQLSATNSPSIRHGDGCNFINGPQEKLAEHWSCDLASVNAIRPIDPQCTRRLFWNKFKTFTVCIYICIWSVDGHSILSKQSFLLCLYASSILVCNFLNLIYFSLANKVQSPLCWKELSFPL